MRPIDREKPDQEQNLIEARKDNHENSLTVTGWCMSDLMNLDLADTSRRALVRIWNAFKEALFPLTCLMCGQFFQERSTGSDTFKKGVSFNQTIQAPPSAELFGGLDGTLCLPRLFAIIYPHRVTLLYLLRRYVQKPGRAGPCLWGVSQFKTVFWYGKSRGCLRPGLDGGHSRLQVW